MLVTHIPMIPHGAAWILLLMFCLDSFWVSKMITQIPKTCMVTTTHHSCKFFIILLIIIIITLNINITLSSHTHTVWGLLPLYFSLASQPAAPVQRVGGALCFHSLTKKSQQCRMGRDYMGWRYRLCTYIYIYVYLYVYICMYIYNCMYVISYYCWFWYCSNNDNRNKS